MNARFVSSLESLGVPDGAPIGLAVSGGPDSLALLLLAAQTRPRQVRAATVDHGLRAAAAGEAAAVKEICAGLGVPHETLGVAVTGSVQAGARAARYAALGDWCGRHGLAWLATAHHVDDQAETVLMRLARGAGLGGLAGVRRRRPLVTGVTGVTLMRPLLDWRKAELQRLVADAGLTAAADPGNTDPAYDRTAARALLATTPWLGPVRVAASAAHLAEAEAALAWATERAYRERFDGSGLDAANLPAEIVRRLVLRIFEQMGERPRGPELMRLIDTLRAGHAATLGSVKASPGPRWTFAPAPPRRPVQRSRQ